MNTDVSTIDRSNSLANPSRMADMGGITQEDLQIPKLSLIQKMSKVVDEGKAKAGDIFDSMEQVVLGDEKQGIEFIPLHMSKSWREYEVVNGDEKKYLRTVPFSTENSAWRYEAIENGVKLSRQLVVTWHVLLVSHIANGGAIPYAIDFKGMNINVSKKLSTFIAQGSFLQIPIYGKVYSLQSLKVTNERATFHTFDVKKSRVTTPDEISQAQNWVGMFGEKAPDTTPDTFEG